MASQTIERMNGLLSHGTIEIRDIAATREFFEDFLGLNVIQPLKIAIYADTGGGWRLVCVRSGLKTKPQARENRFCLHVGEKETVLAAHAAAIQGRDHYKIQEVEDVESSPAVTRFVLQDLNNVWWEISDLPKRPFD